MLSAAGNGLNEKRRGSSAGSLDIRSYRPPRVHPITIIIMFTIMSFAFCAHAHARGVRCASRNLPFALDVPNEASVMDLTLWTGDFLYGPGVNSW